jgi:hypothetical protein
MRPGERIRQDRGSANPPVLPLDPAVRRTGLPARAIRPPKKAGAQHPGPLR